MKKTQKVGFIAIAIWIILLIVLLSSLIEWSEAGLGGIMLIVIGIVLIIPVWFIGLGIGKVLDRKRK